MLDRGNPADYLFARQLLGAAADRVQRLLFERRFNGAMIMTVAPNDGRDLLLAVGEAPAKLNGQSFDTVFGADTTSLVQVPDRVLSVRHGGGALDISACAPSERRPPARAARNAPQMAPATPRGRRLAPSLKRLSLGSERMAAMCARAQACYRRGLPFVIEGPSGTGKSSHVAALIEGDGRRISAVELQDLTRIPAGVQTTALPAAGYDERLMIEDALAGARWNVSQAARTLGMGRATIHRKMKHFGISRPA